MSSMVMIRLHFRCLHINIDLYVRICSDIFGNEPFVSIKIFCFLKKWLLDRHIWPCWWPERNKNHILICRKASYMLYIKYVWIVYILYIYEYREMVDFCPIEFLLEDLKASFERSFYCNGTVSKIIEFREFS